MVGYNPDAQGAGPSPKEAALAGSAAGMVTRALISPLDVLKIRFQVNIVYLKTVIIHGFYGDLMWPQVLQQLSSDFPHSSRLSLCPRSTQRDGTGECVRPPAVYFQRRASPLFGKATSRRSSFPSATALSRSVKGRLGGGKSTQILCASETCAAVLFQFTSFEFLTKAVHETTAYDSQTSGVHFVCGGLAACSATVVCQPLDTLRTRFAAQGEPKVDASGPIIHLLFSLYSFNNGRSFSNSFLRHLPSQVYSNLRHAVSTMCRTEGALTFYRGLSPTLLAVFPYAGLQFFSYNVLKRLLAPPPSAADSGGQ